MTTTEVWAQLPQWLELPDEVQTSFAQYDAQYTPQVDDALRSRLLCRNTWDDALAELRHRLDPDPTGLRMLWELLHVACGTYARYVERGISQEIFVETMKFCTDACVVCDEEGLFKGKEYNCNFLGVNFVGTILLVGIAGEEFCDVPGGEFTLSLMKGVV